MRFLKTAKCEVTQFFHAAVQLVILLTLLRLNGQHKCSTVFLESFRQTWCFAQFISVRRHWQRQEWR